MTVRFVEHHYGRFVFELPPEARVVAFAVNVDGVDLREFDLGDGSPEALELAWSQVTEREQESDGFVVTRTLPGMREAVCELAGGRSVVAFQQTGDGGLLLRAVLLDDEDPRGTIHDLRNRYEWPRPEPRPPDSFGLARGLLDLRPELPEELSVGLRGPAHGWRLGFETCTVAVASPSDFAAVKQAIESMPEGEGRAEIVVRSRTIDGLDGEEMFVTLGAGRIEDLEHQAIWRFPGRPGDVATPEVEFEFSMSGVERDVAMLAWEQVVSTLRRVEGGQ